MIVLPSKHLPKNVNDHHSLPWTSLKERKDGKPKRWTSMDNHVLLKEHFGHLYSHPFDCNPYFLFMPRCHKDSGSGRKCHNHFPTKAIFFYTTFPKPRPPSSFGRYTISQLTRSSFLILMDPDRKKFLIILSNLLAIASGVLKKGEIIERDTRQAWLDQSNPPTKRKVDLLPPIKSLKSLKQLAPRMILHADYLLEANPGS